MSHEGDDATHGQGPLGSSTDLLLCENERAKAKNIVGLMRKLVPL